MQAVQIQVVHLLLDVDHLLLLLLLYPAATAAVVLVLRGVVVVVALLLRGTVVVVVLLNLLSMANVMVLLMCGSTIRIAMAVAADG